MAGARNALNAPAHRIFPRQPPQYGGFPPGVAPSLDALGSGIQDHRLNYNQTNNNDGSGIGILGFYGDTPRVINAVPSTLSTAGISALANAVQGTPVTLAGASTGITVLAAALRVWPSLNIMPVGTLVLDGNPAVVKFGGIGFVSAFYDPASLLARAVSISGVTSGTGGDFLVLGADVYGYPLSQTVTVAAGANTVNSLKAFKFIFSVTPQFSDAHNYSVGTSDVYGLPLYAASFFDQSISWNAGAIVAVTGFVAGVTTVPSTRLLGDVRGTYATQSASDGTKRLIISQRPSLAAMATNPTNGLFGVPQV